MTKVFSKILLMKSSGSNFIFLPAFYLINWVMKAPKNFGKITILKIWELISLGGVKTHFGKLALKWCIFRHEKNCFNWYYVVAFDPIKILTLKAPQNDRLNLSFVKDFYVVAKKWPEMVIKWPFMSQKILVFFLTKLKIKGNDKNCDSCCSVWSN